MTTKVHQLPLSQRIYDRCVSRPFAKEDEAVTTARLRLIAEDALTLKARAALIPRS